MPTESNSTQRSRHPINAIASRRSVGASLNGTRPLVSSRALTDLQAHNSNNRQPQPPLLLLPPPPSPPAAVLVFAIASEINLASMGDGDGRSVGSGRLVDSTRVSLSANQLKLCIGQVDDRPTERQMRAATDRDSDGPVTK
uniref:Uncharacterized protein n=1 Tax=Plectus sambesii TaxID=2011161 RepID=A0A914W2H5_9BILA